MKRILTLLAVAFTLTGYSQNPVTRSLSKVKTWATPVEGELFAKGETQIGFSGSYTALEPGGATRLFENDFTRGVYGANVGITYFTAKYFGIGVDLGCTDLRRPSTLLIDSMSLNIVGRLPIGHVAPYVIAGIGREFSRGTYALSAGPGIEFRLTKHLGFFGDMRFSWRADKRTDTTAIRTGANVVF